MKTNHWVALAAVAVALFAWAEPVALAVDDKDHVKCMNQCDQQQTRCLRRCKATKPCKDKCSETWNSCKDACGSPK